MTWLEADRVQGLYMGKRFAGTLTAVRRHSTDRRTWIATVRLDRPVRILGRDRDTVSLWVTLAGRGSMSNRTVADDLIMPETTA